MSKIAKLDDARRKCRHCGEFEHDGLYACPRLASVYEDGEGGIQYEYVADFFDVVFVSDMDLEDEADQ